jgi:glutathione S-transferase
LISLKVAVRRRKISRANGEPLRRASGLLADYPNLAAYVARAEARPAYQRAFAAQLAVFEDAARAS